MAYDFRIARVLLRLLCELTVRTLAAFACANLVLGAISSRYDGNWIWINLDRLPSAAGWCLLGGFAVSVFGYRRLGERARWAARCIVALVGLFCLLDAWGYYTLILADRLRTALPVPVSLLFAAALLGWSIRPEPLVSRAPTAWRVLLRLALGGAVAVLCLLAQVGTFGATDYRRPADVIVVYGAGVRPDGQPSLALYDRVRTGCELYHEGLAKWIVFSGGRNSAAPVSEPQAMRAIALDFGVPDTAILLDEGGVDTRSTIVNAAELGRKHGWRRFLMVSHGYHLSRIKLISRRAALAAYTVPARETRALRRRHYYMLRELAAWLYYYVQPKHPVQPA